MTLIDKKQLKAQRRQANTDRVRAIDRMKYTHKWSTNLRPTGAYSSGRVHVDTYCKKCGMGIWNFKMKPMTCDEAVVYDIISNTSLPGAK